MFQFLSRYTAHTAENHPIPSHRIHQQFTPSDQTKPSQPTKGIREKKNPARDRTKGKQTQSDENEKNKGNLVCFQNECISLSLATL
jgi:hypothetical protein